ncbi:Multicopper oxidase [Paenibacillus sp. UNC496MF]|uniref:multicopper oxidase domain-containing protein n=1 Tax=Paenibacillus sp. UNC496MF TaxID=1502753 RepID=UPI0008E62D7D|nr:multicopper oxidase domain-containing protein [Paenibacillus sp. UNC496MF]SFI42440.1 Multicopper oxidase [Paenibacillus sp. UNC496MF]
MKIRSVTAGFRNRLVKLSFASALLFASAAANVYAHGDDMIASSGEMGEGPGIQATVDGRYLASGAMQSSDLSEIRLQVREVAEALGYSVKWDARHRAVLIGTGAYPAKSDGMAGMTMAASTTSGMMTASSTMIELVLNGKLVTGAADPMFMGNKITAVADELASALGLHYQFNAGKHLVSMVSDRALEQFAGEESQVRDVLNGKGMTPEVDKDGVKQFTLTAKLHDWSPVKGMLTTAWTLNGQVAAPTIRVTEGDRVRIAFHNDLTEPSTIHWHGLLVPNDMDGVPGITQDPVQPGGTYVYEFTASHAGTFIYHSHYDDMVQVGNGMYGAFIIDPKTTVAGDPNGDFKADQRYDHDYTMVLSGFRVNTTGEEEEDYFTINGRSYPDTPAIEMKQGETARVRLINTDTMEIHTMHLHGMDFQVIARNGSPVKSVETMNTVMLGPGETVDLAFKATAPGNWMFHCHILDHTMNGGDMSGGEMGGLITLVKVKP